MTLSGPQSPPQIRRAQLAAAAILSSSSREQPGHRMRDLPLCSSFGCPDDHPLNHKGRNVIDTRLAD
ncbi:hypothetical protein NDU88_007881 [Pleurodeles waltl]|uniref:Uncharacterized protein n=1 Tax=Pleurodeles waltl TaxID=8319 RepID=A0AAV7PSR0_PLEWA|nr:hypothetical protein NDU88_007881 [Pleurodeles waltl]